MAEETNAASAGRVLMAMSGGVDSSVAASRLVAQGYEVVGVTLHLWDYPDDGSVKGRCCAPEDQYDARRTADRLGIAHYAFDRREQFMSKVVNPFVDDYLAGQTPSPCVRCNRGVKTFELFELADRLGAEKVATGHYARVVRDEFGNPWLARAIDSSKDQSYFLHALNEQQLERVIFPLGDATKPEVRAEAAAIGLPGATKGESQELCFVPTGRYDAFVEAHAKDRVRPGPILDDRGRVVGEHKGVHNFTVGQRKGIGVALGYPAFVVGIDTESAAVKLGPAEALEVKSIEADDVIFSKFAPELIEGATVKVRARHEGATGTVRRQGERFTVEFDAPVKAVSLGQYAVVYRDGRVYGGGRICRVLPR